MTTPTSSAASRALLVISAEPPADLAARVAGDREPQRDYVALQTVLGADMLTPAGATRTRTGRLLARVAGKRAALIWMTFRLSRGYDAIFTDAEYIGLPFALLRKMRFSRPGHPRHVMLTHYLTPAKKRLLFRLGAMTHVDALIVHSSAQRARAVGDLRVPASKVHLLPYFTDTRFWRPQPATRQSERPMICAVGLEFRDYDTLVTAARGLDVDVRIAAGSHWSHHDAFAGSPTLPPNVTVASYNYADLRALYAAAHFVVVPLREVDNQAGITVILEAMAMGKAVIVSGTRGQTDVVRDRRNGGRGRVVREWWPGFVDAPEVRERLGSLPTGFYVHPGDAEEMRDAIAYLLRHPSFAEELGRNGRRVVEELFTLDAFARRFAALIRGERPTLSAPLTR